MIVEELIAKLEELDPKLTVIFGSLEENYDEAFEVSNVVKIVVAARVKYYGGDPGTQYQRAYFRKPWPKDTEGLEEVCLLDVN